MTRFRRSQPPPRPRTPEDRERERAERAARRMAAGRAPYVAPEVEAPPPEPEIPHAPAAPWETPGPVPAPTLPNQPPPVMPSHPEGAPSPLEPSAHHDWASEAEAATQGAGGEPVLDADRHEPAPDTWTHDPALEVGEHGPAFEVGEHEPALEVGEHGPAFEVGEHEPAQYLPAHEPAPEVDDSETLPEIGEPGWLPEVGTLELGERESARERGSAPEVGPRPPAAEFAVHDPERDAGNGAQSAGAVDRALPSQDPEEALSPEGRDRATAPQEPDGALSPEEAGGNGRQASEANGGHTWSRPRGAALGSPPRPRPANPTRVREPLPRAPGFPTREPVPGGRTPSSRVRRSLGSAGRPDMEAGRGRRRLLAVIPLLLVLGALWFCYALFQPLKGHGHGRVDVTIPSGAGAGGVGRILARDHVISSGLLFSIRATLEGKRGELRSGHFVLARDMSYGSALDALTRRPAPVHTVKVTIPEGRSRREIAALAAAAGLRGSYLAASTRSNTLNLRRFAAPARTRTLEGFLFPATYDLPAGSPAQRLVDDQLASFNRAFAPVSLAFARHRHLSAYDLLIVASMVEREAGVARDRPLIAAVIYNRLRLRMPLGIDATIRYALNNWTRPLTSAELRSPSRFNTRTRRGLPPTPIGNPGLASIQAAAHPAHAAYLYYVVKPHGHGEHAFSSTFAQFQRDVARYRVARTSNGGRSPTG